MRIVLDISEGRYRPEVEVALTAVESRLNSLQGGDFLLELARLSGDAQPEPKPVDAPPVLAPPVDAEPVFGCDRPNALEARVMALELWKGHVLRGQQLTDC
jgi:hypothetical protein